MMETQPPPDETPPPATKEAVSSRTIFRVMMLISVFGGFSVILWLLAPQTMRAQRNGPFVAALGNVKQLGLALMEFEKDFGSYPDALTLVDVKTSTGTDLALGTATTNDFLRQLIAAGHGNEKMCSSRIIGSKTPDGVITGSNALEKGECGFAYIPGLNSSHNTNTPVLITPLIPGTDKIDPKPFGGKAIILRIDGSVMEGMTDKDGHLIIFGKRLLDPTNPIWGGKPPTLVWPE